MIIADANSMSTSELCRTTSSRLYHGTARVVASFHMQYPVSTWPNAWRFAWTYRSLTPSNQARRGETEAAPS
jgi:hypothetical protein